MDGALIANNPSLVALQEAHRIWPDEQIGFLLSVGVGSTPTTDRQEGISSYLDTGSALLESATDVEEVHRAMEVVGNLVPGLQYERLAPCDARCDMDLDCAYSNSSDSLFSTLTRRSLDAPTLPRFARQASTRPSGEPSRPPRTNTSPTRATPTTASPTHSQTECYNPPPPQPHP